MPFRFPLLLIVIFQVIGCAPKHKQVVLPVGIQMNPGMVNEFRGGSPLEIVNAQPDNHEMIIHRGAYFHLYGVMHDWTEAVVTQLRKELSQREINIVPQANKKLSLCVKNAKIFFGSQVGGGQVYSSLKLKVESGNGHVRVFEGNHSANSLDLAVGGAVTSSVAVLLRDPSFLEYITK